MPTSIRILLLPWEDAREWAAPLRREVFVREQGVPEALEWDEQDASSLHAVALDRESCVGTGRLLPADAAGCAGLGRMAVRHDRRRKGIGRLLLQTLIEEAKRKNVRQIVLHAQTSAMAFYRRFGFSAAGPEFQEAGIPHREMRLALDSISKV
jgi:predicted GNAT family N-acyltransferase